MSETMTHPLDTFSVWVVARKEGKDVEIDWNSVGYNRKEAMHTAWWNDIKEIEKMRKVSHGTEEGPRQSPHDWWEIKEKQGFEITRLFVCVL